MIVGSCSRKRSSNMECYGDSSEDDNSTSTSTSNSILLTDDESKKFARQNHSEIEKRRREKMNTYIQELCNIIPSCSAMKSKLDKLTILRMAVQHMKSLRGATISCKEANYKPSFLSEDEIKQLILENAEGFLFVVSCDRGRILYMSESVMTYLNIPKEYLLGQSIMDMLHPKDIGKVKEQLSSLDLLPAERLIDAKTGMLVRSEALPSPPQLSSGARRSFFCRMRKVNEQTVKSEAPTPQNSKKRVKHSQERKNYVTVHCTGYLKSWPSSKVENFKDNEMDNGNCNLTCLVAIGRLQPILGNQKSNSKDIAVDNNECSIQVVPLEYVSRLAADGKLTFADQRVTIILGYLPQEFVGTSVYEYYHIDDIPKMAEFHKSVLTSKETQQVEYLFKAKNGEFLKFHSRMFCFRNPWTKEIEYIVSTNTTINLETNIQQSSNNTKSQLQKALNDTKAVNEASEILGLPVGTRIGAGKIGRMIADEVMELEKSETSSLGENSLKNYSTIHRSPSILSSQSFTYSSDSASLDISLNSCGFIASSGRMTQANQSSASCAPVRQNQSHSSVQNLLELSSNAPSPSPLGKETGENIGGGEDEAAMAFIMSMLEADAGLGGSVDLTEMPWPF
ncbi:protein cycle-like [Anneissia japonica]|uniref:protein cycle-like n=1 Tax=Anneissia japonica TaxID=1529436 RepID=UPI0014257109|nr:protein cycle-like [Anneissia japonica]